ncbi:hypothetical protein [Sporomusa paucivorans]|uniref:hypothetical protein n=1 Tax=Sporomusa paucivorans TaxID=2376 RepID=UPI003570D161
MYYFFLDDKMLPVPPPKMEVKVNNKNKTVNLINEGEINIIKSPGLTEVSFEVMMPNEFYPFALYDNGVSNFITRLSGQQPTITYAKNYIDGFEKLKTGNNPFRLIIARFNQKFEYLSDTNMLVTLEEYNVGESSEYGFDWQVPMRFKQYRPYATKELEITTNENGEQVARVKQTRPTTKEVPKAYKVAANMTLWEACRRASGGSLDWKAVAELNGIRDNNVLKGTVLNLK